MAAYLGADSRTRTDVVALAARCPGHWTIPASTFWSGRRESNPYPELGRLVRSHYATPALVSRASPSREGTTPHWRPWQESNPQTFRFGDGVSTIASRPTTTGVIDETRTRYQQIHNLPAHLFAFDHHTSGGPNRIRTGDFLRDKQARTARLLYESGKKTHR